MNHPADTATTTVILLGFERPQDAVQHLQEALGIPAASAQELAEQVPVALKRDLPWNEARDWEQELRRVGAYVELRPSSRSVPTDGLPMQTTTISHHTPLDSGVPSQPEVSPPEPWGPQPEPSVWGPEQESHRHQAVSNPESAVADPPLWPDFEEEGPWSSPVHIASHHPEPALSPSAPENPFQLGDGWKQDQQGGRFASGGAWQYGAGFQTGDAWSPTAPAMDDDDIGAGIPSRSSAHTVFESGVTHAADRGYASPRHDGQVSMGGSGGQGQAVLLDGGETRGYAGYGDVGVVHPSTRGDVDRIEPPPTVSISFWSAVPWAPCVPLMNAGLLWLFMPMFVRCLAQVLIMSVIGCVVGVPLAFAYSGIHILYFRRMADVGLSGDIRGLSVDGLGDVFEHWLLYATQGIVLAVLLAVLSVPMFLYVHGLQTYMEPLRNKAASMERVVERPIGDQETLYDASGRELLWQPRKEPLVGYTDPNDPKSEVVIHPTTGTISWVEKGAAHWRADEEMTVEQRLGSLPEGAFLVPLLLLMLIPLFYVPMALMIASMSGEALSLFDIPRVLQGVWAGGLNYLFIVVFSWGLTVGSIV
ncbi:MAG: hypothetical protein AAFS10_16985, partial [Myxococcota bacterium]